MLPREIASHIKALDQWLGQLNQIPAPPQGLSAEELKQLRTIKQYSCAGRFTQPQTETLRPGCHRLSESGGGEAVKCSRNTYSSTWKNDPKRPVP